MNISEYYLKLNNESQQIFQTSIRNKEQLGRAHHLSSCIFEFSECISEPSEKEMLKKVSNQLESGTFNLNLGMYRQAFSSLRLALEMGLGAIHFSVHKMELHEWLDGRADIKWASLVDPDNGVLSIRFARAFFPELADEIVIYRSKAVATYRSLSEYVHGNSDTWDESGLKIVYKSELFLDYFEKLKVVAELIMFLLICRYIKNFDMSQRESLQFIPEEFNHIVVLREIMGGPKG